MLKRYQNPHIQNLRRTPLHFLGWLMGIYKKSAHLHGPEDFQYPLPEAEFRDHEPSLEWVNHCTFLLEIEGVRILTDPIWSDRCSPFPFLGPKRRHDPSVEIEKLPPVDIVLISHNHYDHLDAKTVIALNQRFPNIAWYVPKGLKHWFIKKRVHKVYELDWWQESSIKVHPKAPGLVITAVPAQHNSGRGIFDVNSSLWVGYVVTAYRKNGGIKKAYFVGDTAYNPHDFKKIGRKFTQIDLALAPIGTYEPREFMKTVHSGPVEAVSIHQDVNAKLSVAMHWKTFKLSAEPMHLPPYDLYCEMVKRNLNPAHFLAIEPGHKINW